MAWRSFLVKVSIFQQSALVRKAAVKVSSGRVGRRKKGGEERRAELEAHHLVYKGLRLFRFKQSRCFHIQPRRETETLTEGERGKS